MEPLYPTGVSGNVQPGAVCRAAVLALFFCSLCIAPLLPEAGVAEEVGRDGKTDAAAPQCRIVVYPTVVYTRSTVRLRLVVEPALTEDHEVSWRSSGGLFLFDDLQEVEWKAPREAGEILVSVEITGHGKTWRSRTPVKVRRPSTQGMRWIPPGEFIQGDILGTRAAKQVKTFQNSSDEPFRTVHLDGFWMDRYPVTNEQFKIYLDEILQQNMARVERLGVWGELDGSWVPFYYFQSYEELVSDYLDTVNAREPEFRHRISWDPKGREFRIESGHEMTPVVDVSWFGASAYARFYGKRLPSEAQWEKAARGTDQRKYPWGNNAPTAYHGNVNYARGVDPLPVGSYVPYSDSPYGVSDMVAGLFEWTGDWFNGHYYKDNRTLRPHRNPTGTFWGRAHAIRSPPYALFYPGFTFQNDEAVSFRYHWNFEFFVGDIFANRETTFRTVVDTERSDYRYDDPF